MDDEILSSCSISFTISEYGVFWSKQAFLICKINFGKLFILFARDSKGNLVDLRGIYILSSSDGKTDFIAIDFISLILVDDILKTFSVFNRVFRSEERRVGKECRSRWSP